MNRHERGERPYGRHREGIPVAELLQRAIDEGRPLWLEWLVDEPPEATADDDTQAIPPVNDWFTGPSSPSPS